MRMIVQFEKGERLRFLGHMDMQRAMQRAVRRSGLPAAYSQGFHPHLMLAFASPLPVGMAGREELLEIGLETYVPEADFAAALGAALPPDLPLGRVRQVDAHHPKLMAALRTALYQFSFPAGGDAVLEALPAFLAQASIPAVRVSKTGEKPCDIRPMLHALEAVPGGMAARVSFTEAETLKPDLLLRALAQFAGVPVPAARVARLRLFGESGGKPAPLFELPGW
jgi:radical SAM-linked protein